MKRFEYKIQHFLLRETDSWLNSSSIENTFNYLGDKGWELVKVSDKVAFFKREITDEILAEREAEQKAKEAEEKAWEEERIAQMTDVERAYHLVENTPQLQHSSEVYGYVAKLKHEEITFDEFMEKMDELMKQRS